MFTASTQRVFASGGFSALLAADRDFMLHAVERRGIHFDTRLFPVVHSPERAVAVLWFILVGVVEIDGRSIPSPAVISLSERDYQGAGGKRFVHYRTGGNFFRALEVRIRTDGQQAPPQAPTALPLDRENVASIELLWRALSEDAGSQLVVDRLNTVTSQLPTWSSRPPLQAAPHDPRVLFWDAFRAVYSALDTASSIKHLSALARGAVSSKRVEREVARLLHDYLFPAANWRDITNYTRLGLAAFLLSSPGLSVSDVAKEVGYAHAAAMTNAFARGGLPAPSKLRELLGSNTGSP